MVLASIRPRPIATANREHCCVGTDSCASLQLGGTASQTNLPSGRRTPAFLKLVKICVGFGPSARARKEEKTPSFGKSYNLDLTTFTNAAFRPWPVRSRDPYPRPGSSFSERRLTWMQTQQFRRRQIARQLSFPARILSRFRRYQLTWHPLKA